MEKVSKNSVALKYGVIGGLIGIIWFVVIDFAGFAGNQAIGSIGILFTIAVMYFSHKEYLKEGDGYMSYGDGLALGTLQNLYSGIISGVFTYIYVSFINPSFLDTIKEKQIVALEEKGMSDAEIEQAMKIAENFSGPVAMLVYAIIGGVFIGFIVALIVSAFTKNSRPEFE